MAQIGSRWAPFSMDQFNSMVNMNNWHGGWVTHNDGVIYHSADLLTCSSVGAKDNPIPNNFYNEMFQNGIWLGGWVQVGVVKYYNSYGIEYDSNIGEENYPCPMNIYYEMVSNAIWKGGWIDEGDGLTRYVQNFPAELIVGEGCGCGSGGNNGNGSGSGSGSGNGSGCGCGNGCDCGCGSNTEIMICPIEEGEEDYAGVICIPGAASIDVKISWTDGGTSGLYNLSEASITLSFKDYRYSIVNNNTITIWDEAYTLGIRGWFGVEYLNHPIGNYSIDASYTIPSQYR